MKDLVEYEKILTLNDNSFSVVSRCFQLLLNYIQDKCKNDREQMQYFQLNFTDSEKSPFAQDLKIKWSVTKDE